MQESQGTGSSFSESGTGVKPTNSDLIVIVRAVGLSAGSGIISKRSVPRRSAQMPSFSLQNAPRNR
jgi:hypothetical protein